MTRFILCLVIENSLKVKSLRLQVKVIFLHNRHRGMEDKGVQVAIGSKRKKTSPGGQTTTLETPKEERATQCGMPFTGSYGRNREHNKWRYDDLVTRMQDKEILVHWLMNEGLMAKERCCPMCAGEMSLTRCEDRSDGLKWECRKQINGKKHRAEVSIRRESWFDNSKMTLEEILKVDILVVPGS